jgi:hypothetical protein
MKVKAWKATDGTLFEDVAKYQTHELDQIIMACEQTHSAIANGLINRKDDVINILTLKESSHPAARKANGAQRKPRKGKTDSAGGPPVSTMGL